MKNKNQVVKQKNKAVQFLLIGMSCVFFVISGVLVFLTLNKISGTGQTPVVDNISNTNQQTINKSENSSIQTEVKEINSDFNKSVISIVLDAYGIHNAVSLKEQTCVVNTADPLSLLKEYTDYLTSLEINGISYKLLYGDYDSDGEDEYYLYIYFPVEAAFIAFGNEDASNTYNSFANESMNYQGVVIYGDSYAGKTTFRSYYSGTVNYQTHNIFVNNGVMKVNHGETSEIYLVCTPYVVYEDYAYQSDAFKQMCESYAHTLGDETDREVFYYCADVSDAPGEEVLFVYSDSSGNMYARVLTFINGKVHFIYENVFEACATFIVEINSQKYILEYQQYIGTESTDYTSNYHYSVFRFDENYCASQYESAATNVEYDSISAENEEFFSKFNSYLKIAIVIADPYELTGYRTPVQSVGMSTHQDEEASVSDEDEDMYLYISNCSTSKQGIVNVPETSYLNFREGPSTNYNKILINPSDDESYVRQLKGATVTVIDTVNTSDEENPVWLRIQIKYNELTLIGYSSQAWIDLPGVKYISAGNTFTVTASTNDENLRWSCNDTSVATIDSSTGVITAHKPGVVLITVTSQSGLTDSCLVAVN